MACVERDVCCSAVPVFMEPLTLHFSPTLSRAGSNPEPYSAAAKPGVQSLHAARRRLQPGARHDRAQAHARHCL